MHSWIFIHYLKVAQRLSCVAIQAAEVSHGLPSDTSYRLSWMAKKFKNRIEPCPFRRVLRGYWRVHFVSKFSKFSTNTNSLGLRVWRVSGVHDFNAIL